MQVEDWEAGGGLGRPGGSSPHSLPWASASSFIERTCSGWGRQVRAFVGKETLGAWLLGPPFLELREEGPGPQEAMDRTLHPAGQAPCVSVGGKEARIELRETPACPFFSNITHTVRAEQTWGRRGLSWVSPGLGTHSHLSPFHGPGRCLLSEGPGLAHGNLGFCPDRTRGSHFGHQFFGQHLCAPEPAAWRGAGITTPLSSRLAGDPPSSSLSALRVARLLQRLAQGPIPAGLWALVLGLWDPGSCYLVTMRESGECLRASQQASVWVPPGQRFGGSFLPSFPDRSSGWMH